MTIAMEAAVLDEIGAPFTIQPVELDEPRAGEILVRTVATGVCGTDLHVQTGGIPFPLPGVVGHEGAGIVEAVGPGVTSVAPGDKVLMTFTSCGRCRNCLQAHPAYCEQFIQLNLLGGHRADGSRTIHRDGQDLNSHFFAQSSFATRLLAEERSVTKVHRDADLGLLAPLGCGIQTGAGAVLNILRPEPGSTIVIFGAGAVGLAAAMAAALTPAAHIVVVDIVPGRLDLAAEVGATLVIDSRSEDVNGIVMALTSGRGAAYAVDVTGVTGVLDTALAVLAPGGTLGSIGAPPAGTRIGLDVNHMLNGRRFVGITEGDSVPQVFLPALAELVTSGRFPLHKLIRRYAFAEINDAVAAVRDGSVVKPVLLFAG